MIIGNKKLLHLGSGNVRLPGWINIDGEADAADMKLDLRQPLPFSENEVDGIFAEHFIEHITRPEAVAFLRECYRVLKPNAIVRLSTPDLRYLIAAYISGELDEWRDVGWIAQTSCQLLNEGMRLWGHQWLYDNQELSNILAEAGFSNYRHVDWRKSSVQDFCDLESRPYHRELIVEAVK